MSPVMWENLRRSSVQPGNARITSRKKERERTLNMTITEGTRFSSHHLPLSATNPDAAGRRTGYSLGPERNHSVWREKLSASSWATELTKRATGKTFYILDEPTTGLHFDDIARLLVCSSVWRKRAIRFL